jgi:hypothetical protein
VSLASLAVQLGGSLSDLLGLNLCVTQDALGFVSQLLGHTSCELFAGLGLCRTGTGLLHRLLISLTNIQTSQRPPVATSMTMSHTKAKKPYGLGYRISWTSTPEYDLLYLI